MRLAEAANATHDVAARVRARKRVAAPPTIGSVTPRRHARGVSYQLIATRTPPGKPLIARLTGALAMSERTLRRRFDEAFGYSPRRSTAHPAISAISPASARRSLCIRCEPRRGRRPRRPGASCARKPTARGHHTSRNCPWPCRRVRLVRGHPRDRRHAQDRARCTPLAEKKFVAAIAADRCQGEAGKEVRGRAYFRRAGGARSHSSTVVAECTKNLSTNPHCGKLGQIKLGQTRLSKRRVADRSWRNVTSLRRPLRSFIPQDCQHGGLTATYFSPRVSAWYDVIVAIDG